MRKVILSFSLLSVCLTALADNAIVFTTKNGEQKFVAFEYNVALSTNQDKELVVSTGDGEFKFDIADITSIKTQDYDFSSTTSVGSITADESGSQLYDINGRKVSTVTPGQIYIIKKGNKTTKQIAR